MWSMENKYKMAVVFNTIPAIINIIVLIYIFFNLSGMHFRGYFIGTVLGIILSVIWLIQVKKAFGSHAIRLLKITLVGFLIKFLVFVIFIAGFYYLIQFNRTYFAVSFFIALLMSSVIELWFYASLINQK